MMLKRFAWMLIFCVSVSFLGCGGGTPSNEPIQDDATEEEISGEELETEEALGADEGSEDSA